MDKTEPPLCPFYSFGTVVFITYWKYYFCLGGLQFSPWSNSVPWTEERTLFYIFEFLFCVLLCVPWKTLGSSLLWTFRFLNHKKMPQRKIPTVCSRSDILWPDWLTISLITLSLFHPHLGNVLYIKNTFRLPEKDGVVNQISQKQQNIGAINTSLTFVAHERENAKSSAGWLMAKRWELSLSIKKNPVWILLTQLPKDFSSCTCWVLWVNCLLPVWEEIVLIVLLRDEVWSPLWFGSRCCSHVPPNTWKKRRLHLLYPCAWAIHECF